MILEMFRSLILLGTVPTATSDSVDHPFKSNSATLASPVRYSKVRYVVACCWSRDSSITNSSNMRARRFSVPVPHILIERVLPTKNSNNSKNLRDVLYSSCKNHNHRSTRKNDMSRNTCRLYYDVQTQNYCFFPLQNYPILPAELLVLIVLAL